MKISRLCLLVAAPMALLGCSAKVPTGDSVRAELERRIAAESNGCMSLVQTTKTNGYEAPSMANTYVVLFDATIEFEKDCKWSSPMFEQGKHRSFATTITDAQARKKGGFWGEFFNVSQNPGAPFTQGTRVRVAGEQAFIKTEQGYRPLTDMFGVEERERIFSDRDIRLALIAQLESWNEAMYPWFEAAWAANPGANQIKTLRMLAVEVAERGGSPDDIRAALELELVPRFMKELPTKDGWGNALEYMVADGQLFIRSPGKDGKFTWEPGYREGEFYDPENYDGDLVLMDNGTDSHFLHGPNIREVNPFSDVPG